MSHTFGPPQGRPLKYLGLFDNLVTVTIDFTSATWNTVATHEVFTVTGVVAAATVWTITETLTSGGAATMGIGIEGAVTNYGGNYAVASLTAGVFPTPGGTSTAAHQNMAPQLFTSSGAHKLLDGLDIGYQINVAAMTDGTIVAYCFWTPISAGATVVAGAGGSL